MAKNLDVVNSIPKLTTARPYRNAIMFSLNQRVPKNIRRKRAFATRRGTVAVEMAMVAPVIFVLIFGSIEFARMMMVRQALTNAARTGCRDACLASTQTSASSDTVLRESLSGVITNSSATEALKIEFEPSFTSTPPFGTTITTTVEINCSDVSWLPPFFTRNAKIQGTCSMNRE